MPSVALILPFLWDGAVVVEVEERSGELEERWWVFLFLVR